MKCPACAGELSETKGEAAVYWACESCGGKGVGIGLLRRLLDESFMQGLWRLSRESEKRDRPCPSCSKPMAEIATGGLELEVCTADYFVWFDAGEFDKAPAAPKPEVPPEPELPQAAREALGIFHAELIAERAREERRAQEMAAEIATGGWQGLLFALFRILRDD